MPADIALFAASPIGLNEIHNAGSALYVAPLADDEDAITGPSASMQRILSPTNLPLTDQSQTVDRKDLTYGLQGSQVKVGVTFQPQITLIAAPSDTAFWEVIYPAKATAKRIYVHIARSGDLHAFGAAFVTNMTIDGNINEICRPQFTLDFQAPFALPTLPEYLTADELAELNASLALCGLDPYTVSPPPPPSPPGPPPGP